MRFVDEVNQKTAVDIAKHTHANGAGYFVHQSGPYQNSDPGYSNQMPFWFSPNVAIYCSSTVPECRLASWGQQSRPRPWTERIIYYERYRDCGDGILERTHLIHNAELESTNTVLNFANMPWGGTRYTTLKDFQFSQNPDTWNYNQFNLTAGIEDPMLIFSLDASYGLSRIFSSTWTLGYTLFAEDLPFYRSTPPFYFPGRLPKTAEQPLLIVSYGQDNTYWLCQGPLNGFQYPHDNNYRCRFADTGVQLTKGCNQCYLRFTNSIGQSFSVYNVRHWIWWNPRNKVNFMYFNSYESLSAIKNVMTNGTNITVTWDESNKKLEDNLALSFVHGTSQQMTENNQYQASKLKFGHSNTVQRDFAIFEYISYPSLAFGDSFRARQYYITDRYLGLSNRSMAIVADTREEVISSGEFEVSSIKLHYIDDGGEQSTTFGVSIDDYACNSTNTANTIIACTGSSTPQIGKNAFIQIQCGVSTYVGTDFYHYSNYPITPYRATNCKIDGITTSTRPIIKLLGYFDEAECGTVLQDKIFDPMFCV